MDDFEVPFWSVLIIAHVEMAANNVGWAFFYMTVAAFCAFMEWKSGEV